jgi:hypothetical protein
MGVMAEIYTAISRIARLVCMPLPSANDGARTALKKFFADNREDARPALCRHSKFRLSTADCLA